VLGFDLLGDGFPNPYIAHWQLYVNKYVESERLPGVRIRCNPHPGVLGRAPSTELRQRAAEREAEVAGRGGFARPSNSDGVVPSEGAIAREALRTVPPRETAGNIDIKQHPPGTTVLLPGCAEGGLVPTGDVHYA
jgi:formamidase